MSHNGTHVLSKGYYYGIFDKELDMFVFNEWLCRQCFIVKALTHPSRCETNVPVDSWLSGA